MNSTATTAKTPGYNCRIAIWFDTDKNGRKVAYRWSGRAIRIGLADAELFAATDAATVWDCHPLKGF